jgi:SAM-dependent methyltransferase
METVTCNLCGSSDSSHYMSTRDRMLRTEHEFHLVRCQRCGLVYLNPRPDAEEMQSFYPEKYEVYAANRTNRVMWHLRRLLWRQHQRRLGRYIGPDATLLEVGCGTGEYLAFLRDQAGWKVIGTEFSEFVARKARDTYRLQVQVGPLRGLPLPAASFDAVVMKYVLEHVPDPLQSLARVHRLLKPDGILFITVPDLESWEVPVFGQFWNGLDSPRHLFLFQRSTIEMMLRKCGFTSIELSHTVIPNDVIQSLRYLVQDRGTPEALVHFIRCDNPLLVALVSPFSLLMGKIGRSGAIEVLARKQ